MPKTTTKRKRGRPRKNPAGKLDPDIQHGIYPRYHQPCIVCPECGKKGEQLGTQPYHPLHALERHLICDNSHTWVELRKMGT